MPRVKVARKSTAIDMTAMCDVAFLLLTFFILTAKPKVTDPSKAEVPASTNQKALPEENLGTISIGQGNKIFYSMTGNDVRAETLKAMGEKYNQTFSQDEINHFAQIEVFGVPMAQMKSFLALSSGDREKLNQPGIPADTTNNSELSNWILLSRKADRGLHDKDLDIAIKGDKREQYPTISTVITILEKQQKFKFSLVTDLKTVPKK